MHHVIENEFYPHFAGTHVINSIHFLSFSFDKSKGWREG